MVKGTVEKKRAILAIDNSKNALRAVGHAGFMLSGTDANVTLFHSKKDLRRFLPKEMADEFSELQKFWQRKAGKVILPFIQRAKDMLLEAGLRERQILTKLIDGSRSAAADILEDIMNTGHRPKVEDFDDYDYIVLKILTYDQDQTHITAEQVSFIIGPHYRISFQETEGDVFNFVRERIRKAKGRIRKSGCDFLAYALIDAIVDHYFLVLEKLGEKIELLEEDLLGDTQTETLQSVHHLKREMIFFRKQVWPLREILSTLMKEEGSLIQETTQIFIRDLYDHTIQVMDTIESFRDVLSGLQDLYLSTVSNRMNEVMKVLTIMATIFIPLTFIAGIYGMNFEFMPELKWRWSYPVLWVILVAIFLFLIFWFKKKKWL